jgi:hypothetical protein
MVDQPTAQLTPATTPTMTGTRRYGDFQLTENEALRLGTYLGQEIRKSLADTAEFREKIDLWRTFVDPPDRRKNFPWAGASSFFAPIGRLVIDSLKAATKQTITRQKRRYVAELVSAVHAGIEESQTFQLLRAAEDFAEKVSVDPAYLDMDRAVDEVTEEAFTTGIGLVKLIIENDSVKAMTAYGERDVAIHVGPRLYLVPTHTWVWPAGIWRGVQDMPWTGHFFPMTDAAIQARKEKEPWNYQNVDRVIGAGATQPDHNTAHTENTIGIAPRDRQKRLFDIALLWDVYDNGKLHDINVTFHLESESVLRVIYNPAGDGLKPYEYEVGAPRSGHIPGRGSIEPIVQPIRGVNTAVNQAFDSQTLANSPCIISPEESDAALTLDDGFVPGTHLTVKEDPKEIQLLKFPDPSAATFQLVDFFMSMIQQLTRVNPSTTGEVSESRRTPATLGLAIQQSGAQLINEYIDRLRDTMGRLVSRAFVLYYLDDANIFEKFLGEPGKLLRDVVKKSIDERRSVSESIRIRLSASSATRSVELERQNALATAQMVFQQLDPIAMMAHTILGAPMPNMPPLTPAEKDIALDIIKSKQEQLKRIVELSDIPDSATLIPDIAGKVQAAMQAETQTATPLPPAAAAVPGQVPGAAAAAPPGAELPQGAF